MKHLSILGILAILALTLDVYFSIVSNFKDFKQGFEDGMKTENYHSSIYDDMQADPHAFMAEVMVTPISVPNDSLNLQLPGETVKVPYHVSKITCLIKETSTMLITIIFAALGIIVLSVLCCLLPDTCTYTYHPTGYFFPPQYLVASLDSLQPVSIYFNLTSVKLEHRAGSPCTSIPAGLSGDRCHPDTSSMGFSHPDRITYRNLCHSRKD